MGQSRQAPNKASNELQLSASNSSSLFNYTKLLLDDEMCFQFIGDMRLLMILSIVQYLLLSKFPLQLSHIPPPRYLTPKVMGGGGGGGIPFNVDAPPPPMTLLLLLGASPNFSL